MSEEEIINYVEELLRLNYVQGQPYQAIKGLLDLYNKEKQENIKLTNTIKYLKEEKERNKELLNEKESVFDKGYLEGTRDGEETIRDEIRAIIKDYYERKSIPDLVISRIEELLEENKSNENNI